MLAGSDQNTLTYCLSAKLSKAFHLIIALVKSKNNFFKNFNYSWSANILAVVYPIKPPPTAANMPSFKPELFQVLKIF